MDLKNDAKTVEFLEEYIFPNIHAENTVLFLGAGFSYTEERNYLGKTILNYYQEILGVDLETNDLVEFLDRASRLESFSRQQFDQYVKTLLQKLKPEETHKKVVTMGWRQIVTTNMDLLLEEAYSNIQGTHEENREIVPIRSVSEYQRTLSNDQIKYIKLNGCLSDISKYKLVFSSQDFNNNKEFYNKVLTNYSSLTNNVSFLSIGYSFTDGISKRLLTELNKNNLKNERKIFNIDPYPNDALIPFLEENNIITIRMKASEFFGYYDNWVKEKYSRQIGKLPKVFFNSSNTPLHINPKLNLRVRNHLKQLHINNRESYIKPENFYKGEEPNYSVILDNYDVLKENLNNEIVSSILKSEIKNNLIPAIFISGTNGIGKTTSSLRAINELQLKHGYVAFELTEINGLRAQDLEEIFNATNVENFVLFADNVERHTYFKELMLFRVALSEHQFNKKIAIIAPIRENILEKHLRNYKYKNTIQIEANHKLTENEINDLISKLKFHKLINVRDKQEENRIKEKIRNSYESDPYVTMLSLIENSTLLRAISDNLNQINPEAQKAFEYTSLLYQYKIPMPASILKKIINIEWNEFKENILKIDCKGLLINEISYPIDIKEDLIFKTKHRIISSKFIASKYKNEDKLYKAFLNIFRVFNPNEEHAKIAIDLLKAIKKNRTFTQKEKLYKLFDEAAKVFVLQPSFNIHYARNLQERKNIESLLKAANKLMQVDSVVDRRNSALTHTRGVIEFQLAKHYHKNKEYFLRDEYLESALEFFEIKISIDPFSSYSYYDFISFEMWKIKNLDYDYEEVLKLHLKLQDLFVKAYESVIENVEYIEKLRSLYINEIKINQFSKAEILKHLEELYSNPETRVLALIFKLNALENEIFDFGYSFLSNLNVENIIDELSVYHHLDIVEKALFDYHCRRLYNVDSRMALNIFNSESFIESNFFKFHYYSYIKECYNQQFKFAESHLISLRKEFKYINPSIQEKWIDSESLKPKIFTGIIKNVNNYKIYIPILGSDFFRFKSDFEIEKNKQYYCTLIFTIKGIRVNIISEI